MWPFVQPWRARVAVSLHAALATPLPFQDALAPWPIRRLLRRVRAARRCTCCGGWLGFVQRRDGGGGMGVHRVEGTNPLGAGVTVRAGLGPEVLQMGLGYAAYWGSSRAEGDHVLSRSAHFMGPELTVWNFAGEMAGVSTYFRPRFGFGAARWYATNVTTGVSDTARTWYFEPGVQWLMIPKHRYIFGVELNALMASRLDPGFSTHAFFGWGTP